MNPCVVYPISLTIIFCPDRISDPSGPISHIGTGSWDDWRLGFRMPRRIELPGPAFEVEEFWVTEGVSEYEFCSFSFFISSSSVWTFLRFRSISSMANLKTADFDNFDSRPPKRLFKYSIRSFIEWRYRFSITLWALFLKYNGMSHTVWPEFTDSKFTFRLFSFSEVDSDWLIYFLDWGACRHHFRHLVAVYRSATEYLEW